MTSDWHDRPNRIPWPPIVFAGIVAAAVLLHAVFPLGDTLPPTLRFIGAVLMVAGIVLDVSAMVTMRRHRANIQPHRAATTLVTTGPFALSRNPIYLGNTLLIAGAGIAFNALWLVLTAILGAWLVSLLAIHREEAHLAARFGEAWTAYAQRTPRLAAPAALRCRPGTAADSGVVRRRVSPASSDPRCGAGRSIGLRFGTNVLEPRLRYILIHRRRAGVPIPKELPS